jgi:hypothetical protein
MTISAQQFLSSFDSLPEADKHDVAVAILQRVATSTTDDLSDDALVVAAAELFRAMDAEEAQHAES